MNKTIFQKIIDREIPAEIVYEDDSYIAFLDIFPKSAGHTLVVPKSVYRWVDDVPEFGAYWETARTISRAIATAMNATYMTYQTYGVEVPHAHIHIVPRYNLSEDHLERSTADSAELARIGEAIRQVLASGN